ncbi:MULTISPECIES: ATPase domain-containing protein [Myxococcaceae]|uniref:ATPase domain-containing protein n=1 Tax=Myxococcaceae TaxID=31 RepID=UPI00188F0458|nr:MULTISPECIES: ATPase domain-containing protein [Myxococcaceae]MBF5043750.1 AAA family ATPase [Simulacricoccus sp. 17bor-14]
MLKSDTASRLIPTGVSGLDEVLFGGVTRNNIILVEGAPGTGKTTLGLGFIHAGARRFDEPGVIVTFELSPQKLLRDARGYDWDFEELERQRKVKILYTSPSVLMDELQSTDGVLASEIAALGAKRLLIDGLTPLQLLAQSRHQRSYRESLHLLVEGLQRLGITALLTREIEGPGPEETSHAHERFVCDTIITLGTQRRRRGMLRTLEVVKSRGQEFLTGQHTLRIEAGHGIQVYRRSQSRPHAFVDQPTSMERVSSGCPALDGLMQGGLYRGSVTLTVGISGTGKTVSAVQFLTDGAKRGERGLLVTLDEHPQQLIRNAATLGLDLAGPLAQEKLFIHYESPLELELDVHFDRIARLVEQHHIQRVVLDSVAAYEAASPEEATDFMYALATYLKRRLCTVMCNYESPELLGVSQISENLKASHLVDNIILFNYVEVSTRLRRAITIPKVRGSKNVQKTREYVIGQGGISLLDEDSGEAAALPEVPQLPFSSYYGLLSRSPARQSPVIETALQDGGHLPRSPRIPKE